MIYGLLTNQLVKHGMTSIEDIAVWASSNGFKDLEVGPTIKMDEEVFTSVKNKINISALTYCRNFLSSDEEEAILHKKELVKRIEFAGKMNIEKIVTSTGIDKTIEEGIYDSYNSIRKSPKESIDKVVEYFLPIIEIAVKNNVKIAFENCPLMGNIAISPSMWRTLLDKFDSENVGIAYDPSHLVWQFINPYDYMEEFKEKIFHIHAKDTKIHKEKLARTGFLTDFDWWEYSIPGTGDIDWDKFMQKLKKIKYNHTISIEHEDENYTDSLSEVQEGLIKGRKYLEEKELAND